MVPDPLEVPMVGKAFKVKGKIPEIPSGFQKFRQDSGNSVQILEIQTGFWKFRPDSGNSAKFLEI